MKKILAITVTAVVMTLLFAATSLAADTRNVSSLHFTMDASAIGAGSDPADFDRHSIKIECTDVQWDPNNYSGTAPLGSAGSSSYPYPGLTVRISDLQSTGSHSTLKVGDTVKIKFWVEISGHDENGKEYVFNSSSKAHVSAASGNTGPTPKSTSKSRSGYYELAVSVQTNAIKGEYDPPEDLQWKSGALGQAKWNNPESGNSAKTYDIRLKREDHTVVTFTDVSATSMNFFPWMTREGDYSFEVRSTVSSGTSGAKKSDWVESDSQYVDEKHVSDGTGQFDPSGTGGGSGNTGGKVGWVKDGNTWYYIYPDGTMRKNGWEKVNNKWYYFDASGAMKTGWVTVNGQTYYLDATNGDMKVGWVKTSDGQWYYLNPNPAAGTEGAMYRNQWLSIDGQTYFLKDTGAMATGWLKIDGRFYYFNPNEGGPKGAMVKNTRIDSFYLGADGAWVQGA